MNDLPTRKELDEAYDGENLDTGAMEAQVGQAYIDGDLKTRSEWLESANIEAAENHYMRWIGFHVANGNIEIIVPTGMPPVDIWIHAAFGVSDDAE